MNIIGDGFYDSIINQVIQRQKIYGSGYYNNRVPEEIIYLNANTSWCKLVSSVNVDNLKNVQNQTIKNLGLSGNNLAKQFVLFNGTYNESGEWDGEQRSGIDLSNSLSGYNFAYGIGGTDFGLRPMMGIQSVEVKHENRGSIRRATVKMKAWNRAQFDIIDVLYLRLGFNVLLEWGHSMYYNNAGDLVKGNEINNSLVDEFLSGGKTYDTFLSLIQKQRLSSNGNYDAMFAKVTNFHWSFQKDGSYDIELNLVSVGDVMESFKVNLLGYTSFDTTQNSTSEEDGTEENKKIPIEQLSDSSVIAAFANQSSIGSWFFDLITKFLINPVKEVEKASKQFAVAETTASDPQIQQSKLKAESADMQLKEPTPEEQQKIDAALKKFFPNSNRE